MIVVISSHKSTSVSFHYGVPQCGILGPLLFILYVNDIPNSLEGCQYVLYADDLTIVTASSNAEIACRQMPIYFNNVKIWAANKKINHYIERHSVYNPP